MAEKQIDYKKVYAKGYYDGQRAAGMESTGESMNEAKLARKEEGLNGQARKVLDAVPIQQPWAKEKIVAELRRTGSNAGRDVIEACLNVLRGHGLVREPEAGLFIRVQAKAAVIVQEFKAPINQPVRTAPTEEVQKMAATNVVKIPEQTRTDALSKIAGLAQTLRQKADELDGIALEYEERMQAIERDTDKLRQLQTLLKSLGQ